LISHIRALSFDKDDPNSISNKLRRFIVTSINSSSPLNSYGSYVAQTGQNASDRENSKKLVIEVSPGENNVDSGDRSNNTADIKITTPEREINLEVSREQVFNAVERRTYKNLVTGGDNSGRSLLKAGIVAQSDVDKQDMESLAYLKVKQQQIDVYSQATANSPYNGGESSQSGGSEQSTGAQQYVDAKNSLMKQSFISATIDRLA